MATSLNFRVTAIGQEASVCEDAAACHWICARPWSEQDGFQKGILFGVLLHRWALKAIDRWDVYVMQDDFLGIAR